MGFSQSTPGACIAGNTTYAGRTCSMQCAIDYPGGDYKQISTNDFIGCLQACAADTVCTDSSFDRSTGVCYLKSYLVAPRGVSDIDSAVCWVQDSAAPSGSTATVTTTLISTTTAAATSTITSTTTTTAPALTITSITTSISTDISTSTAVSTLTVTSVSRETDVVTPAASSLPFSLCTFTYTSTATTYTSTLSTIGYTLPAKCYDTAVIQSLQPSPTSSAISTSAASFAPTIYACSSTTYVVSTTTVAAVATAVKSYSWPFLVQALDSAILNGSFGRVVTYDSRVGNSFMQLTAPAQGPATQYQLDDNCVLGLGWNTSNPDWISADEGSDGLVYFGTPKELGQPQYSTNTSCAVTAASVLTCKTSYGNATFLTGANTKTDQFNNVLNVAQAGQQKNIFGNQLYPVTLALTFL